MRDGNFDADKVTLLPITSLLIVCRLLILVADVVLCESNFFADAEDWLEPITIAGIVDY
jgi:hypothetical protein